MSRLQLIGMTSILMLGISGCNLQSSGGDDSSTITLASFLANGDVLEEVISDFEESTGHTVEVREYTDSSEAGEMQAIRDGESADIVVFPQPGRIHELREEELIQPLRSELYQTIEGNNMTAYVSDNGQAYALPYSFNVKSIIWYSRSSFEEAGLNPPASDGSDWEDFLSDVSDATKADDAVADHVWCIGMSYGISAGDWFEELLLQNEGIETYSSWANNDEGFSYTGNDPDIVDLLNIWNDNFLAAAPDELETIDPIEEAARGIQGDEPNCFLHTQASWITYAFGDDLATSDEDGDIDFFAIPQFPDNDNALRRIGGDFLVKVNDVDGVVDEFLSYVWEEDSRAKVAAAGPGKLPANTSGQAVQDAINENYIRKKLSDWYGDVLGDGVGIDDVEVFDGTDLLPVEFAHELEELLRDFAIGDASAQETVDALEDAKP